MSTPGPLIETDPLEAHGQEPVQRVEIEAPRPRIFPKILALVALAIVLMASFMALNHRPKTTSGKEAMLGQPLRPGVVRLKGTTEAIQSRAIVTPVLSGQQLGSLTVTRLLPAGTRVKRGDLLVEFDRQAQVRDFLDKQAEYDKLVTQVNQQVAKEDAARAKDETELHQAESDLKNAELEIKKVELLSRIDVEKAHQNLEQSTATLKQLKETFALKRNAARAAIRILEIQRDRTQEIMQNAKKNADLMQIRSPLDGVVVLNMVWKSDKMSETQEGDQLRPGIAFMQVVDPSIMQVQVPVNQQDLLGLRIGQRAKVHLDAYPDLEFSAKIDQISPVGRAGSFSDKVRTFSTIFSIEGNDPRLMPDLSAAVDVESDASSALVTEKP